MFRSGRRYPGALAGLALGSLLFVGCGGGGGSTTPDVTTAITRVSVPGASQVTHTDSPVPSGTLPAPTPDAATMAAVAGGRTLVGITTPQPAQQVSVGAQGTNGSFVASFIGAVRQTGQATHYLIDVDLAQVGPSLTLVVGANLNGQDTQQTTINLNVQPAPAVNQITVMPAAPSLAINESKQLTATLTDASNNTITVPASDLAWSSSAPAVATVDANGKVTAVGGGTAQITVQEVASGKTGTTTVTVATTGSAAGTIQ